MQTFTVKSIEERQTKDGTKTFFIITDMTGAQFSLWEPIGMIKNGCVMEADIEIKGKYNNIKNFKITSQPTEGEPHKGKPPLPHTESDTKTQRSIERQVAAKLALEFSPQPSLIGKLYDAEVIYCWIAEGALPPQETKQTASSSPAKPQPASPESKPATSSPEKSKEPATVQQDNQKASDTPANLGEFLTWVTSHKDAKTGKAYTTRWLYSQFSFKETDLLSDASKLKAAFTEVKQQMMW